MISASCARRWRPSPKSPPPATCPARTLPRRRLPVSRATPARVRQSANPAPTRSGPNGVQTARPIRPRRTLSLRHPSTSTLSRTPSEEVSRYLAAQPVAPAPLSASIAPRRRAAGSSAPSPSAGHASPRRLRAPDEAPAPPAARAPGPTRSAPRRPSGPVAERRLRRVPGEPPRRLRLLLQSRPRPHGDVAPRPLAVDDARVGPNRSRDRRRHAVDPDLLRARSRRRRRLLSDPAAANLIERSESLDAWTLLGRGRALASNTLTRIANNASNASNANARVEPMTLRIYPLNDQTKRWFVSSVVSTRERQILNRVTVSPAVSPAEADGPPSRRLREGPQRRSLRRRLSEIAIPALTASPHQQPCPHTNPPTILPQPRPRGRVTSSRSSARRSITGASRRPDRERVPAASGIPGRPSPPTSC